MSQAIVDDIRNAPNEQTSLLHRRAKPQTPLPRRQVAVIMLSQFVEPVSHSCILPFLNQMVGEFDIVGGDPSRTGYFVGLMVSIFFAAEAITVLYWSRLSDRIGRKPVLLVGLAGITISMILVGMSRSFWVLVFSRALAGSLNGNTGVAKSALGEITDNTNVAKAFALFPLVWNLGTMVAPLMGGFLQHPHERFPAYFDTAFWKMYPYLLPCLAAAAVSGTSFLTVLFFFEETRVSEKRVRPVIDRRGTFDILSAATERSMSPPPKQIEELTSNLILQNIAAGNALGAGSLIQGEPSFYPHPPAPAWANKKGQHIALKDLLQAPGVALAVGNYGLLAVLDIAFCALQPLFFASPVPLGGLGLSPAQIGMIMGGFGLINGCFQMTFFAPILERLGARRTFVTGILAFVPIFGSFVAMNVLARMVNLGATDARPGAWSVWLFLAIQMASIMAMDLGFGVIMIYIRNSSPSKQTLGATNGIAQLLASIARTIGPAASTSLFAFSVGHDLLGGYAVYLVLILATAVAVRYAAMLPAEMREGAEDT